MKSIVHNFLTDESGATAVEYALILGLFAITIIIGGQKMTDGVDGIFATVTETLDAADDAPSDPVF